MSEHLRVKCPQCGVMLQAPAGFPGRFVKCAKCGARIQLPEPGGAGPEPPQLPASDAPDVVRANRLLAGRPCPACGEDILLGDEVVRCARCDGVSHSGCWRERGGCASQACQAGGIMGSATLEPSTAQPTEPCRACAEQIPVDAKFCPFCSEPVGGVLADMPNAFIAKKGAFCTKAWSFRIAGDELVGTSPKADQEIRSKRDDVILKKRKFIIKTDELRARFTIDDIGYIAVDYWLTGKVTPRTSVLATDALSAAIVGICFCVLLEPLALVRGYRATKTIDRYPHALTGRGLATAAKIIAIVYMIVFATLLVLTAVLPQ